MDKQEERIQMLISQEVLDKQRDAFKIREKVFVVMNLRNRGDTRVIRESTWKNGTFPTQDFEIIETKYMVEFSASRLDLLAATRAGA